MRSNGSGEYRRERTFSSHPFLLSFLECLSPPVSWMAEIFPLYGAYTQGANIFSLSPQIFSYKFFCLPPSTRKHRPVRVSNGISRGNPVEDPVKRSCRIVPRFSRIVSFLTSRSKTARSRRYLSRKDGTIRQDERFETRANGDWEKTAERGRG